MYSRWQPRPLQLADGATLARNDGLPLIMGVLNVTPDSFSDGGRFDDPGAALAHALAMWEAGADIIDVGAESSRPGAELLSEDEEWRRLEPVLIRLADKLPAPVSVDTWRSPVASRALDAGAAIINDIGAGRLDQGMLPLAARRRVPICLMHMLGEPRTMQRDPRYGDVAAEVRAFLAQRAAAAKDAGVKDGCVIVDPGFGFGKTPEHNAVLVKSLAEFRALGLVLLGLSRKSSLAAISGYTGESRERLPESLAGAIAGAANGADILRVHDAGETVRALRVARAMT